MAPRSGVRRLLSLRPGRPARAAPAPPAAGASVTSLRSLPGYGTHQKAPTKSRRAPTRRRTRPFALCPSVAGQPALLTRACPPAPLSHRLAAVPDLGRIVAEPDLHRGLARAAACRPRRRRRVSPSGTVNEKAWRSYRPVLFWPPGVTIAGPVDHDMPQPVGRAPFAVDAVGKRGAGRAAERRAPAAEEGAAGHRRGSSRRKLPTACARRP